MATRRNRWGDNDRYFGPFTYARDTGSYKHLNLTIQSGNDDYPGCRLRLSGFGHTLILALPAIIKPYREKVIAHGWDAATIARMGRDWYYNTDMREYGVAYSEGFLQVYLGRQTHDSSTEQRWSKFLPWTQWRHVRHSLYGLNGEHYWTEPARMGDWFETYEERRAIEDACPAQTFNFTDYDGEALTAKTNIEEREWHFGEGWFKWLSLFRKPKIKRSLNINFSNETGRRKGSWKGGTMGTGIDMTPGELHSSAFQRYCAKNEMVFIGKTVSA